RSVRGEAAWQVNPVPAACRFRQRSFRQPITKLGNETLGPTGASSPLFWRKVAAIRQQPEKFSGLGRPYATTLLTMIKIVLIAPFHSHRAAHRMTAHVVDKAAEGRACARFGE